MFEGLEYGKELAVVAVNGTGREVGLGDDGEGIIRAGRRQVDIFLVRLPGNAGDLE
jgi:hypothetical protein